MRICRIERERKNMSDNRKREGVITVIKEKAGDDDETGKGVSISCQKCGSQQCRSCTNTTPCCIPDR